MKVGSIPVRKTQDFVGKKVYAVVSAPEGSESLIPYVVMPLQLLRADDAIVTVVKGKQVASCVVDVQFINGEVRRMIHATGSEDFPGNLFESEEAAEDEIHRLVKAEVLKGL